MELGQAMLVLVTTVFLGMHNVNVPIRTQNCFHLLCKVDGKVDQASGFQCPSTDGLHPNPAGCTSFIQCSNGIPFVRVILSMLKTAVEQFVHSLI
jgi:hypothetical protein